MTELGSRLDPSLDSILYVADGRLWGIPVAHASWEIGHARQEPTAILGRQGFYQDRIAKLAQVKSRIASRKATSCRMYTGLIGRLEGMVSFSIIAG